MRTHVPLQSLDAVDWQPAGVPGIEIKPLNLDPDTGARTSLLRSAVRNTIEHRAQYHPGDEEFLCLDGRFTFDGRDWFGPGSYVHFPPRTVHGVSVQVPGGYLLYLRTTGMAVAHPVAEPLHPTPYALDVPEAASPATIRRVTGGAATGVGSATGVTEALRHAAAGNGQATWIRLQRGEPLSEALQSDGDPLEILLVSGALRAGDGRAVQGPAYGFYAHGLRDAQLVAAVDSTILAHTGALA